MIESQKHIISRYTWDTSFDSKEAPWNLQNKISHWSKHYLPQQIDSIFDEVCPEGHTLKIKRLELNLGVIAYSDLHQQLPKQLRKKLRAQLLDLIHHPEKSGLLVEIEPQYTSYVKILKGFLQNGIMPWNHHPKMGNADTIFSILEERDSDSILTMLLSVADNDTVRKRLAWQFKEVNVQKVIMLLEPNNHDYIFDIVEELTTIQQKENIVRSSTNDFKRNIWYWVLTYLFQKRDSLFNKVAFVKSEILAISNHFNVAYGLLLTIISEALAHVEAGAYHTAELITVLRIITKEHEQKTTVRIPTPQQPQLWEQFEQLLPHTNTGMTPAQKRRLNELILSVSKDTTKLKRFILRSEKKSFHWSSIVTGLTSKSKEILLLALVGKNAQGFINDIVFIKGLNLQKRLGIHHNELWKITYQYVMETGTKTYITDLFVAYLISQLSSRRNSTPTAILGKLLKTEVSLSYKTHSNIGVFNALQAHLIKERKKEKIIFSASQFKNTLDAWVNLMESASYKKTEIIALERRIIKWSGVHETEVWAILTNHPQKHLFIEKYVWLLPNDTLQKIIKKNRAIHAKVIQALQACIQEILKNTAENTLYLRKLKLWIWPLAFQVSLCNGTIGYFEFLTMLLESFQQKFSIGSGSYLAYYLQKIIVHPQLKTIGVSQQQLGRLKKMSARSPLDILDAMLKKPNQQEQIAALLEVLVHGKNTAFKKSKVKLVQYLLPAGENMEAKLVQRFAKNLSDLQTTYTTKKIHQLLTDWFWQCLADYSAYKGDTDKFTRLFENAVILMFPRAMTNTPATTKISHVSKAKDTPQVSTVERLFEWLTKPEGLSPNEISREMEKLLWTALEETPNAVRANLVEHSKSKDFTDVFQKLISIEQFLVLLLQDTGYSNHDVLKSVFLLYKMLSRNAIIKGDTLDTLFWKYALLVFHPQKNAKKILQYLVDDCFKRFSNEHSGIRPTILEEILKNETKVPAVLKEVLQRHHNVFSAIPKTQGSNILQDLQRCHQGFDRIEGIIESLVVKGKIPAWFQHRKAYDLTTLLNELFRFYPLKVLKVLRYQEISPVQLTQFYNEIDFSQFITMLIQHYPQYQSQLKGLKKLYFSMDSISHKAIRKDSLREILVPQILNAWKNQQWHLVAAKSIWKGLFWEACTKKGISTTHFFEAFASIKSHMPTAFTLSYTTFYKKNNKQIASSRDNTSPILNLTKDKALVITSAIESIPVPNAGIVLLNAYIPMLLERLNLVEQKKFSSQEAQIAAVHYLQYVVTGLTHTEEHLLPLNKILCGLDLTTPITGGIAITENHKSMIEGLIQSCIAYWPEIGNCTTEGFRGNWLVRQGILNETDINWNLTIDKRPYDLLLSKAPFSFSILKFPWMKKPVHVTWSY